MFSGLKIKKQHTTLKLETKAVNDLEKWAQNKGNMSLQPAEVMNIS